MFFYTDLNISGSSRMKDQAKTLSNAISEPHEASPRQLWHHLWHQRAKTLQWVKLNYTAEAQGRFKVISRKGGLLHDAFGRVLEQVDSQAFQHLWKPEFDAELYPQFGAGSPPKAFTLNPPRDHNQAYQRGDIFEFSLVLFGAAISHANACTTAFYKIGQFGLGSKDAKFKLTACDYQKRPLENLSQYSPSADSYPCYKTAVAEPLNIKLTLRTPAYLKSNGRLLNCAPTFTYLLARIIYRANWLSVCSGKGVLISEALRKQLLEHALTVSIKDDNTYVDNWKRHSISRKKWMCFDGLAGSVVYSGVSTELAPLLELIAAINLGGKTSFGMGELEWIVESRVESRVEGLVEPSVEGIVKEIHEEIHEEIAE
jgi:hypothetical protein